MKLKKALNVPAGYTVLYLQGEASLGFLMVAMNMMRGTKKAAYLNTGAWSKAAIKEAKIAGVAVTEVASWQIKTSITFQKDLRLELTILIISTQPLTIPFLVHNYMIFQKCRFRMYVTCHQTFYHAR